MMDPKKEQDVSRYSWSKRGMVHWPIGFGQGAQFVDYGDYCSEREARKQAEAERELMRLWIGWAWQTLTLLPGCSKERIDEGRKLAKGE